MLTGVGQIEITLQATLAGCNAAAVLMGYLADLRTPDVWDVEDYLDSVRSRSQLQDANVTVLIRCALLLVRVTSSFMHHEPVPLLSVGGYGQDAKTFRPIYRERKRARVPIYYFGKALDLLCG